MSDLLTAAADALGTPADLVSRSAAARAEANGTTTDAVLEAWAGGAPAAPASAPAAEPEEAPAATEDAVEAESAPSEPVQESVSPAPLEPLPEVAAASVIEPAPPVADLEPVDLSERLRTTSRIGTWTGAVLGLFAFVMAASSWSQTVTVAGEESFSPIFIASPTSVLIGVSLVSIIFGAVVASLSRAAGSWVNPAMQLASAKSSTAWLGAAMGLGLGIVGGAVLANVVGTAIEGSEDGLIELPVLATLIVMLIGGAVLGGLTTLITQFFAVPIAVDAAEDGEVGAVKARLGNAVGIPLAGLILLAVLVLPFAWTLLESNHLTSGGAAVVAIITASGILAFASLAGSRPNMRIGVGELLVAVLGIGIVVLILFAVLSNLSEPHETDAGGEEARIVQLIG